MARPQTRVDISEFSEKLQKRSKPLSRKEARLLREVILAKSRLGIPNF